MDTSKHSTHLIFIKLNTSIGPKQVRIHEAQLRGLTKIREKGSRETYDIKLVTDVGPANTSISRDMSQEIYQTNKNSLDTPYDIETWQYRPDLRKPTAKEEWAPHPIISGVHFTRFCDLSSANLSFTEPDERAYRIFA